MPRVSISDDVSQEVKDATDDAFRVPDTKISFEERIKVLLEETAASDGADNAAGETTDHAEMTRTKDGVTGFGRE